MSSDKTKPGSTTDLRKKLQMNENEKNQEQGGQEDSSTDQMEFLDHPSYKELQAKLTEAEEKANQYFEKALRIQAEMENIGRRTERDISNAHKYALEKFASELLPVIDNLERAIATAEEAQVSEAILEGLHLTLKLFTSTLGKFGVEQVNPEKEPFNPEFHQAISAQLDKTVKPGTVISVMQKGYLLNSRLIRPAMVVVAKGE